LNGSFEKQYFFARKFDDNSANLIALIEKELRNERIS